MDFITETLSKPRPETLQEINLPRRESYYESPIDWSEEILYFLLPDRFSDEKMNRPSLDRKADLWAARKLTSGGQWTWDKWKESGWRFQGGTIQGVIKRLPYLKKLGITAIWVGPVFKQRAHLNTYHGYGIQDFLDIDPRFGKREDLVELVKSAHAQDIRVILDIVFNHSGSNFLYCEGTTDKNCDGKTVPGINEASYKQAPDQYECINWRRGTDGKASPINGPDDGVWPREFQDSKSFTRAGTNCNIGEGDINDWRAPHKRTDFNDLRDFYTTNPDVLANLAKVYQYWIALTDCDGFRIDTLKHVTAEEGKNFCGAVKEFAANLGKKNFFLVGEVKGDDYAAAWYLDALELNLSAALDINQNMSILNGVAKGLKSPNEYFNMFKHGFGAMGSHRELRNKHVSVLESHDDKDRISHGASSDHQIVAGTALQLLCLGIPCIYYGTEQAFSGPEESEWTWLRPLEDIYMREAMFGPDNPRKSGADGLYAADPIDHDLPGFGPFGTSGHHCFDDNHPAYVRIAALTALRKNYPALSYARQYLRPISVNGEKFGDEFTFQPQGRIVAWSRILADEEFLCVLNSNGNTNNSASILVDAKLCPPGSQMTVVANTEATADPNYSGPYKVNSTVQVQPRLEDGGTKAYIEIKDLKPSEVIVLTNHP